MKKAYDTIDQEFLEEMLHTIKFLEKIAKLDMVCVWTPKFTLMVNGSLHEFILSQTKGLRQGDPISQLLFVIRVEYLSRKMRKIEFESHFQFQCQQRQADKGESYGFFGRANKIIVSQHMLEDDRGE